MPEPLHQLNGEDGTLIRLAKAADRDALLELSRLVFEESGTDKANELTPEFWDWQFLQQPTKRMGVWVAEFEGQIIAQHPLNIIRVKWKDRELLSGVVIDLMVHPEHRKKSLFIRLARAAHEQMTATGVGLSSGFPNANSYPAAIRYLNYKTVCRVPVLVMPVSSQLLTKRVKMPAWLGSAMGEAAVAGFRLASALAPKGEGVEVEEVMEFPKEIDEFWKRASENHTIISVRDFQYLQWRYCTCPTRKYRILLARKDGKLVGYLVHRTFEKEGLKLGGIIDVLVEPGCKEGLHALMRAAISAMRKEGVCALIALMQRDVFYYPSIRRHGFFPLPEKYNPRSFKFVCRVQAVDLPEAELCAASNWFITLGDYDVY
jgi:GNAT superfamily N-acetyltransferase